jgi:hypothetical protein
MEMAHSVGQRVPFGIPVVWHTSGEVDVFVPYEDGRWHADPHMEENPMRIRQLLQSGSSDTQLTLSSLDLTAAVAREVAALLRHYPALKQLDVSANPGLDHAFVSEIGKALSSKAVLLHHHCVFALRHQHLPRVLTVLQELHILLSSTSAALASRACPMTLCSICLVFNV